MIRTLSLFAAGLALISVAFDPALAADPQHPTVVELYQSQGCSSCPPALANINAIADNPNVLALTFAVTYWDQLGWKDTFDDPAYTARQWEYAHAAGRGNVATPQVIINGNGTVVGSNKAQLARAIAKFDRGNGGPAIQHRGNKVMVGAGKTSKPATVWLVRYDPRTLNVPIRAGENGGRTLAHKNIVRSLTALGTWKGTPVAFDMPASGNPNYKTAVLVQQSKGGWILAAERV